MVRLYIFYIIYFFNNVKINFCFFIFLLIDEIGTQDQCICWCQGWAEIHIRRPTGFYSLHNFKFTNICS